MDGSYEMTDRTQTCFQFLSIFHGNLHNFNSRNISHFSHACSIILFTNCQLQQHRCVSVHLNCCNIRICHCEIGLKIDNELMHWCCLLRAQCTQHPRTKRLICTPTTTTTATKKKQLKMMLQISFIPSESIHLAFLLSRTHFNSTTNGIIIRNISHWYQLFIFLYASKAFGNRIPAHRYTIYIWFVVECSVGVCVCMCVF